MIVSKKVQVCIDLTNTLEWDSLYMLLAYYIFEEGEYHNRKGVTTRIGMIYDRNHEE